MNRNITRIVDGIQTSDGAGVKLKRIIGSPELNLLDPFLLFDEFGSDNPEDYIAGFMTKTYKELIEEISTDEIDELYFYLEELTGKNISKSVER